MMKIINPEQLQKELRVATIIYSVNFAAIFIYVAIAWIIKHNNLAMNISFPIVSLAYLRYTFYILSVSLISFVPLLPRFFLGSMAKTKSQEMLLAKLKSISIVKGSMLELPAILGFVLFLLSRRELDFHILCGMSFISLIIFLPRQQVWEEFLDKYPHLP